MELELELKLRFELQLERTKRSGFRLIASASPPNRARNICRRRRQLVPNTVIDITILYVLLVTPV